MNTFTEFCTWQEAPGKLVSDRTNKDYQFVMLRVSIPYIVKHGHSIAFVVRAQIPLPNNICAFKGFHRTTQETGIRKFPSLNFPGKQHPKPKTSFIILKLGNPFSPPQCFPHINNLYMNSLDFQHSHVQQGSVSTWYPQTWSCTYNKALSLSGLAAWQPPWSCLWAVLLMTIHTNISLMSTVNKK